MSVKRFFLCLLTFLLFQVQELWAAVKLPQIFSDHMVIQRNEPIKVWGWADAGERVKVTFNGQSKSTKADKAGKWMVSLKPMAHGGPYQMQVSGRGSKTLLSNILIGDVWICSGQSNMAWPLIDTNGAEEEIASANYPKLRLFRVERDMMPTPQEDLNASEWLVSSSESAKAFSAVAYYFGKNLQQELDVPIGLINTSWGGTIIEAWTNIEDLKQFEEFSNVKPRVVTQTEAQRAEIWQKYRAALDNDKGMAEKWFDPATNIASWKSMSLPLEFGQSELGKADGIVWFSREVEVPAALVGKEALLSLGTIDDADETYVNGELVGTTGVWNIDRMYKLAPGLLKEGKNRITIKVTDRASLGGIRGTPEQLYLQSDGQKIPLTGEWKYKPSAISTDYGVESLSPNSYPSELYNAMIAPLHNFAIKGAIWYQGESNASQGYKYRTLFPTMIEGWRAKWGKDFPFLWVQLANYMKPVDQPAESEWADLREAQSKTLSLPNTGQAVIIDLGEATDIHPRNKKDVGYRLALAALQTAYDKDLVYSGPVFESMKVEGNKAVLEFSNKGSGLVAKSKYGYLNSFAIAGADQQFVWAKAYVDGDKVVVYSDEVPNPVAVRYAWANNPDDANLYNKEGLPASPFRTDNWKTITQK